MARKKINKKFATVLALTLAVGGVGAVGAVYFLRPKKSPLEFEQAAQVAFDAGDFKSAWANYARAVKLSPASAEKLVKLGDLARKAAVNDREMMGQDRDAWGRALEIDPRYLPAIKRLLEFQWELVRLNPKPQPADMTRLRELAERAVSADANEKSAAAMIPTSTLLGWLKGVDTDPQRLEADLKAVRELVAKDPGDGEALMILAQTEVRRGLVARQAGKEAEATASFDAAANVFDDALKARDQDIELHFRSLQAFAELKRADMARSEKWDARLKELVTRSRQLAVPEKSRFVEVNIFAAQDLTERRDLAGAEEVYKSLMEKAPGNQLVRLRYADFLAKQPERRGEAIELLSRPFERTGQLDSASAMGALQLDWFAKLTRLNVTGYRIDQAVATKDIKEREALLRQANEEILKLTMESPEDPRPLTLRGRMEMAQGRTVDAVQTFGRAKTLMERQTERSGEYWELMLRISEAYTRTQQTGPARAILREVIAANPQFAPARVQLIQLLAQEGNQEEVKREFLEAKRIAPNDPAVRTLEAVLTANRTDTDGMKNFRELPEGDKLQRVNKARVAFALGQFDEAARILTDAYAEDVKDAQVGLMLVQSLQRAGRSDEARQVVAKAIEENPGDPQLQLAQSALNNATPEEMQKLVEQQAQSEADPFKRELKLYELKFARGDRAGAMEHLKKAYAIDPSDRRVLDQLFQQSLAEGKPDEAEKYLPKLVEINADQAGGGLYRYRLAQAKGEREKALEIARKLTTDLPQFAQSWLTLGQAHAAVGDWEQAFNGYQQALERQANNAEAFRGAIDASYRLQKPDEAYRLLQDAIRRFPQDAAFREIQLNHELTFGDFRAAVAKREERLKNREDDPAAQLELAQTYLRVAAAQRQRGDQTSAMTFSDKALECLLRVVERAPSDLPVMAMVVRTSLESSRPLAVESALRRVADQPSLASRFEPPMMLGEYYVGVGKFDEAEKSVREAVRRAGTALAPRRNAAQLLAQVGKVDDAVAMLDGADGAAGDKALQRQRAEILVKAGRFGPAEQSVRAMLRDSPGDAELQNLLTIVLVNGGKFEEAGKNIAATLSGDPKNLTALYYRAIVAIQSGGDPAAAVRDLQVVRDNGSMNTDMRMVLVEAFRRANDREAMIRELREAIKLDPAALPARVMLCDTLVNATPPRYDEALRVVEDGLAQPVLSGHPALLIARSRVQVAKGDVTPAVVSARQAMTNSNGDPQALRAYLDALIAAKLYKQVVTETDPIVAKEGAKPFWLFTSRGIARAQSGERDAALNEFAAALDIINDDDSAMRVTSIISEQLGNDKAVAALKPRLDQAVKWRLLTGMLHQGQGQNPEALAAIEPVLSSLDAQPPLEQLRILRLAGVLLVSNGPQRDFDRAVTIYKKLVEKSPDDVLTLNNLAVLISEKVSKPDPAAALPYSERAVDILKKAGVVEPAVFDTHGWILVQNNRLPEGINILNEAANRKSFMEVHYHLGLAYRRAGFPRQAVDNLQRAKQLSEDPRTDQSYHPKIDAELALALEALKKEQENRP